MVHYCCMARGYVFSPPRRPVKSLIFAPHLTVPRTTVFQSCLVLHACPTNNATTTTTDDIIINNTGGGDVVTVSDKTNDLAVT